MYCNKCGAQVNEGSNFCYSCGNHLSVVAPQADSASEEKSIANPYLAVSAKPSPNPYAQPFSEAPQITLSSTQPTQEAQPYAQPQTVMPENRQYSQPSSAPQPQYYQTVKTPEGIQYVAVNPEAPQQKSQNKPNPFAFVSAGIMGIMLLLYFLPWFFVDDKCVGLFSYFLNLSPDEYIYRTAVVIFLVFSLVAIGLLIPGIVIALIKKHHVPMVFALLSSVAIHLSALFFIFTEEAWEIGVSITPVLIWLISIISIVFAVLARKK